MPGDLRPKLTAFYNDIDGVKSDMYLSTNLARRADLLPSDVKQVRFYLFYDPEKWQAEVAKFYLHQADRELTDPAIIKMALIVKR